MKKILICLLIILTLVGCGDNKKSSIESTPATKTEELSTPTKAKKINVKENSFYIEVSNEYLNFIIEKKHGSITKLLNKKVNRDYIENASGANWAMLVDFNTNNPFGTKTSGDGVVWITSRGYEPKISYSYEDDLQIILNYDISYNFQSDTYDGLSVKQVITLTEDANELLVDYTIDNYLNTNAVVVKFASAIISGLKDTKSDLDLIYPVEDGAIYENAITTTYQNRSKHQRVYPGTCSMQLMQLFSEKESLYYYVKDQDSSYKNLNFGDFTEDYDFDNEFPEDRISMSISQYPYLASGNSASVYQTVIGFSDNNSWFTGSDSYRNYLLSIGRGREYNDYVENWTGMICTWNANYGDDLQLTFTGEHTPATQLVTNDRTGIDTALAFGWHKGGFDSKYPDFEFMDYPNYTEAGFETMMENIHNNNDYLLPYLNIHVAALDGKWVNEKYNEKLTNLAQATIKTEGFNPNINIEEYDDYAIKEWFNTPENYRQMCPKSENYQQALLAAAERLADKGVNGVWLDQLFNIGGYVSLCYDESHGHKSPATAYGEGINEILAAINAIFISRGITDYLIAGEGVSDSWITYTDVCGYCWFRPYHTNMYGTTSYPEYTRYTIPTKFLGITSGDTKYNHADAFLMGNPLLEGVSIKDIECTKVYEANPEIYFTGTYKANLGLKVNNAMVRGSVIIGSDDKTIGIQLYNDSSKEETVTITIDLNKYGIKGQIKSAHNMFTNDTYKVVEGNLELVIASEQITSIKLIYEEEF